MTVSSRPAWATRETVSQGKKERRKRRGEERKKKKEKRDGGGKKKKIKTVSQSSVN